MAEGMIIDTGAGAGVQKDTQRMIEIGADEVWTPFLEKINTFMHEEKKARQDNDAFKGAEVCVKIVSRELSHS